MNPHVCRPRCRVLRDAPSVVGLPSALALDDTQHASCCRVEILRLDPRSHVLPHTAPTNVRLKTHLGLKTPPNGAASLGVDGKTRRFADGTVLTFDDSFWHEAKNEHDDRPRFVLSIDFWKPQLLPNSEAQAPPPGPDSRSDRASSKRPPVGAS